jgi:catechol 2,3-dioxygenase-like lactoylglutathione lyase family enzyme
MVAALFNSSPRIFQPSAGRGSINPRKNVDGKEPDMSNTTEDLQMKLEVLVIPVSDVDRSLRFYRSLGWQLDAEYEAGPEFRIAQLTPPGSHTSIHVGRGLTPSPPGSAQGNYLVVSDIDRTRADLISRGIDVSEIYHNLYDTGAEVHVPGYADNRRSYASFVSFSDPDGNKWVIQEVSVRQPGR